MTMALVIALGMNLVTYWFSDKIVLKMYGAQEVTENEAARLYQMVARLSQNAGLPMPKNLPHRAGSAECLCYRQESGTWRNRRNNGVAPDPHQ